VRAFNGSAKGSLASFLDGDNEEENE